MKQLMIIVLLLIGLTHVTSAKQYYGSYFGLESNGIVNNTGSLQKAIDYISEESAGDTLTIWVGRYITGSVELKSNVNIYLREGAILVGVQSPYDYQGVGVKALLWANEKENIHIFGKGVIEGSGEGLLENIKKQQAKGYLEATKASNPSLLAMKDCKNISVEGITFQHACAEIQNYSGCTDVTIQNVTLTNQVLKGLAGIVIKQSNRIAILDSFFKTSGSPVISKESSALKVSNCQTPSGSKVHIQR